MKDRNVRSKNFKWNLETRLMLIEILKMVDGDQAANHYFNASPAANIPLAHSEKWEEVASRLPPAFNAIDPFRRGTTCYSQFNQLRQRFKLMRLDHRGRYRRASNGKRDRIMTTKLCWTLAAYLDSPRLRRRPGQQVAMSNLDNERCTASNQAEVSLDYRSPLLEDGHGKHLPASGGKQLSDSAFHPKLDHESQAEAPSHRGPLQSRCGQSKLKKKKDVPQMRLDKVPRSDEYRWNEDARLQLIEGVRLMENKRSQAGQIESWREIAERLPKHLLWDIDVDRLVDIAKKQFSELRRKYRKIMSDGHHTSGAVPPVKCKSLTQRVLRAMAKYEEGFLQPTTSRVHRGAVRNSCQRQENAPWVTVTPADNPNEKSLGAHGPVRVEAFSRTIIDHQNDSFRSVLGEYDAAYDDSIVPNDGSWSPGCDERESADRQTSSEECRSRENSHFKRRESEDQVSGNAWEAQHLTNRARNWERNEGSCWFDNRQSAYLNRQSRQTVSIHAYSIQPHHTMDHSAREISKDCLDKRRGCSSAMSFSSGDSEPESDCHEDSTRLSRQRGRHGKSSADRDSEGSLKQARHPNLDEIKKGDLQRKIQAGIRQSAPNERDSNSGEDENPQNGNDCSEYQSQSDHGPNSDQAVYDSLSESEYESMRQGDAHPPSYSEWRFNNSESGNFWHREPIKDSLNVGERPEFFMSKSYSPSESQWGETDQQGHGTSHSNHPQVTGFHRARPPIEPAKMSGEFKHGDKTPLGTVEKMMNSTSGPDHDQTFEGPSMMAKVLREVDVEFSKLNWWVQHQLLPQGRKKIKDVLRSLSIPDSPDAGMGSDGECDGAVSKLQHQVRLVLKAELQQVRQKVFAEMDKSSQVVIQEILQSCKMQRSSCTCAELIEPVKLGSGTVRYPATKLSRASNGAFSKL